VDLSTRLRLATRIHFALLRHFGEKVEIGALMKAEGDVREAIWVCEASGDPELAAMARQLRQANELASTVPAVTAQPVGTVPQETAWSSNTSGFGVSRPIELELKQQPASSWLNPTSWLRRSEPTGRH
jgi:hypothetical protein